MGTSSELRQGVIASLSEAKKIKDSDLRERVYDAWALSLSKTSYGSIDELPASGRPGGPELDGYTQSDHLNGVARLGAALAEAMKQSVAGFDVDIDEVIAGGLCHDLGKPFEYDPRNRKRWEADPSVVGLPSMRHTLYGVYLALTAGLPEQIAHIAGAHSAEGENITRSVACEIVRVADAAYWELLRRSGLMEG